MPEKPVLSYNYVHKADRKVVLYLHGFMGDKEDWIDTVAELGEGWSHLSVDLPGHGETAATPLEDHDFTIPGCAAGLVEVLDCLKIDTCHLMAYSMGGRLGLYSLCNYPDRFLSAVIESSSPGLESEEERAARKEHDSQLAERLMTEGIESFLESWYAQPLFTSIDRTDLRFHNLQERRLNNDPGQLARSLRLMGTGAQPSLWNQLGEIACPVMFVTGEKDAKYSRLAERMLPLCPQSEAAIIPGAGHNSHFERPAEFVQIVRRFLEKQR